MSLCPSTPADIGLIRDVLGAVDCNVQVYAGAGYRALTSAGSPFPAALTALLTIYVAVLGYQLMLGVGSTRLAEAPLIAIQIGAVLALTLGWGTFQTLVFDFQARAPMEIARVISHPMVIGGAEGGLNFAADPLDGVQTAYDELSADGVEFGKKAGPSALPSRGGEAAAADGLWRAAQALAASTAGVLAVSAIAAGVVTAVGPVFIALFLFDATRGFFAGWLRALAAAMIAPLLCWVTTCLMLVVLEPWIEALARQRQAHQLSLDTAGSAVGVVLIFAAAQAVLILAGLITAAGFRLGGRQGRVPASYPETSPLAPAAPMADDLAGARILALTRNLRAATGAPGRFAIEAPALGEVRMVGAAGARAVADGAPGRLGETYRRGNVMRERNRYGAAGRA